ncbi:uncharacterized protein [Dermacentor albipictus]|uniref:uncharacterized protein isoform X2 n=1 Tax=Dermacentor albipictus TaxID=60249 RepID=UPI0038FC7242
MANFLTPLTKATTKQCEYIVNARNRLGAHAIYTGGFNANKERYSLYLPSTFSARFAFTVAFQYDGADLDTCALFLAHELKSRSTYLKLIFSAAYDVEYYRNNQKQWIKLLDIRTPVKGFHVLEFEAAASRLRVQIDGENMFPQENVYAELDFMRFFRTGPVGNAPFVFWESHFTATEYFVQFEPKFTFDHDNLSIRAGGYAFIQAQWRKDIKLPETSPEAHLLTLTSRNWNRILKLFIVF